MCTGGGEGRGGREGGYVVGAFWFAAAFGRWDGGVAAVVGCGNGVGLYRCLELAGMRGGGRGEGTVEVQFSRSLWYPYVEADVFYSHRTAA